MAPAVSADLAPVPRTASDLRRPRPRSKTDQEAVGKRNALPMVATDPDRVAGHSLRRDFATSTARGCASDRTIMRHTGHRSRATLGASVEEGCEFTDNAASYIGL